MLDGQLASSIRRTMDAFISRFLKGLLLCVIAGVAMAGEAPVSETGLMGSYFSIGSSERQFLERAVASATAQAGHPVILAINPEGRTGTVRDQAEIFGEKWPERTIVVVNVADNLETTAAIKPAHDIKDRFEASTLADIEGQISEGMQKGRLNTAMAEAVLEVGAIAGGGRPMSRGPWKHPIQLLTGGEDVTNDERLDALFVILLVLIGLCFLAWWLRLLIRNPKEAIFGLLAFLFSGTIGGGGGGSSGGGGSFGGGGATGSW
jgi:uncharacterized protein